MLKVSPTLAIAKGFASVSDGKDSARSAGDRRSILGSGRSLGEGNGNPLQYSCWENSRDRDAWQATVHEVKKSQTRLSNFTYLSLRLRKLSQSK